MPASWKPHDRLEQQAAELHSCMEKLDHINHELEDFTYIASHDLKEPLRGISSYCEIIMEDYRHKMDSDGKRRLNTVIHLCDRLENQINDLLTYCHVGNRARIKTRVSLNTVIASLLKMLRPALEKRNAVVCVAGPFPPTIGNATLLGCRGQSYRQRPEIQRESSAASRVRVFTDRSGYVLCERQRHRNCQGASRGDFHHFPPLAQPEEVRRNRGRPYDRSQDCRTARRTNLASVGALCRHNFLFHARSMAKTTSGEHSLPPPHWVEPGRNEQLRVRARGKQTVR